MKRSLSMQANVIKTKQIFFKLTQNDSENIVVSGDSKPAANPRVINPIAVLYFTLVLL